MPKRTNDGVRKRCRCSKRRWPECEHPWQVNFHHRGKNQRFSLDVLARARNEDPPNPFDKREALKWRDRIRTEIRNGTFVDPHAPKPEPDRPTRLTVGDVADRYLEKHVQSEGRRDAGRKLMEWYVAALRRATVPAAGGETVRLEQKPIDDVTTDDVETIRDGWKRRAGSKGGRVGVDRALKRLRHLFNWAIRKKLATQTPFKLHGVTLIEFAADQGRTRRLEPGEEARLMKHAPDYLQALIVAALETGCRRGELFGLRWRDVKWGQGVLLLPAEITKTGEPRDVPMTQALRAMFELRKHRPDGTEWGPADHVFRNELGAPMTDCRKPWLETCTAAGITGLHFHDLRREFASRLRETPGISDHHVRDWLGHADLATTSRYLATTRVGLQQARRVFEQHRADSFAHDLHTDTVEPSPDTPDQATENEAKSLN
jgi:integrase